MSFVADRTLGPDEKLLFLSRVHWIYLLGGFLWLLGFSLLGAVSSYYLWRYFGAYISLSNQEMFGLYLGPTYYWIFYTFFVTGFIVFMSHVLKYIATEIGLTKGRVIYKRGLIFVKVEEIDLTEIRAERVYHGLLGNILRYGSLYLDSRFVGDVFLPAIKKPYKLLNAIHKCRARRKVLTESDEEPIV